MTKIASVSIENKDLETLVKKSVISVFRNIFADPEYQLKLKPTFIKKLRKSLESKKGGKTITFDKIFKKYCI